MSGSEMSYADAPTAPPEGPPARSGTEMHSAPRGGGRAAAGMPSFVYALGRIEARFPTLAVEKEFAQVRGRTGTDGMTDQQSLHAVIADRQNRYLARQLCWVLLIEGIETYILRPHDPSDLDLLIETIRPENRWDDLDAVIGVRGPIAPPELCNGLAVPIVTFDQIYSFDRETLLRSIPRPSSVAATDEDKFLQSAGELFDRILQAADNAGASDEHRALNYLSVRYPRIYDMALEAQGRNASLNGIDVRPSPLSGVRTIVDVIYSFTHRQTDVVEKQIVRVDVTEEFPFLVSKLQPYIDR